jgi:hypothetical protein
MGSGTPVRAAILAAATAPVFPVTAVAHADCKQWFESASSFDGISKLTVFAGLRFTTNSNADACHGRQVGGLEYLPRIEPQPARHKTADLAVGLSTKFGLALKVLGLELPPMLLARGGEGIE